MKGERVAQYDLVERLGSGAMGEVWLAEDTRLLRPVALKMLPAGSDGGGQAASDLLREARIASALSHPNVAVVYDVGEAIRDGRPEVFIAMEYVRGHTLAELLRDGPLDVAAAVGVARQIAEALASAHEHGIVHRDLKPANVMVGEHGQVKVLDFGLARFVPTDVASADTWSVPRGKLGEGDLVGTLAYMSPEQARGHPLDGRSDVFALGAVLYELVNGRRPFQGRNAVELLEAVLREDVPPFRVGESALGAGLGSLVGRMLEKAPERRPPSMRAVLSELAALVSGTPPAGASGASIAGGADGGHAGSNAVAVLSFANITRNPEDDWLGTGVAETISVGLLETRGVTVVSRERIRELVRSLGATSETDPTLIERMGRELNARWVVSGGYQFIGDQVRLTAHVTVVPEGQVTASVKVDGTRKEIFEAQDRLVSELACGLQGREEPEPARPDDTRSLEAYEALSRGLVNYNAETREGLDRALLFFERARALDPTYARAHMHLGAALDLKGDFLGLPEVCEQALASLDRALELRPDLAEAWRLRGSVLISLGRDDEALRAFERALLLNPTEALAYSGIARVHFILRGDFAKAVPLYERALTLNPRAGWVALQLAHCLALLRDLSRAEAVARRAVALQSEMLSGRAGLVVVGAHMRLGEILLLEGRPADALVELDRELEFLKDLDHTLRSRIFIELTVRRGEAELALGQMETGRASLELAIEAFERRVRFGSDDTATRYYAACAHALAGDAEAALRSLEKTAEKRPLLTAARARIEPAFERLRDVPRFAALVESR